VKCSHSLIQNCSTFYIDFI